MQTLARQTPSEGYVSSTSPLSSPVNSMARGSKNILLTGSGKTLAHSGVLVQGGKVGARQLFNLPNGSYAGLGNGAGGGGSIIGLLAKAFGFIGSGALSITGAVTALSATTSLQLLLYRSGAYDATAYIAGLDPPGAPTIAEHSTDVSTVDNGTTSTRFHFVRSATGGRSRSGPASNVITVTGKKVVFTVSASDLTVATAMGYDRIGIDVTQWGFGSTGPHYELIEIAISALSTVDGIAHSYELEWASSELQGKSLAPIEDDPPPEAAFGAALEDAVAVIGAYGDLVAGVSLADPGTVIAVSLKTFIESFPADYLLYLPGSPVGVLPRPSDGFAFIWGLDFLCALTYTGATPPMSLQTIWDGTGGTAQGNFFVGKGGRLVAFTGQRGIVRIGEKGEPESAWAKDVADETAGWTPQDVVGGWDDEYQLEVFFHHRTALAFNTQIERWCAVLDLSDRLSTNEVVAAAVTVGGKLYFSTRDTVTPSNPSKLYSFHGGSGTAWEIKFPEVQAQGFADEIMLVDTLIRLDNTSNPVTQKIFTNGNTTTAKATRTFQPSQTGKQHLRPWRTNVRGARSYCTSLSQQATGGDAGVDAVELQGVASGVIL